MGDHKLSISDGLIAFGAPLAVAGIEADIPVPTSVSSENGRRASKSNSRAPSLEEPLAEIEVLGESLERGVLSGLRNWAIFLPNLKKLQIGHTLLELASFY